MDQRVALRSHAVCASQVPASGDFPSRGRRPTLVLLRATVQRALFCHGLRSSGCAALLRSPQSCKSLCGLPKTALPKPDLRRGWTARPPQIVSPQQSYSLAWTGLSSPGAIPAERTCKSGRARPTIGFPPPARSGTRRTVLLLLGRLQQRSFCISTFGFWEKWP